MNLTQLALCLIGKHRRDSRRIREVAGRISGVCCGCGVKMEKKAGQWVKAGRSRVLPVVAAVILCVFIAFAGQCLYAANSQPKRDLVVFVGDSITEGVAASDPDTVARPGRYQVHVGTSVDVLNKGVNGITLASLAAQVSSVESLYRPRQRNIIIFHGGSNDFNLNATAGDTYQTLKRYVVRLHDDGWKIAVGTVMARNLLPPQERERVEFNRLVLSGELRSLGIAILDFDALQRAGRVPYADGVHPTDDGYGAMSELDTSFADNALKRP